MEKKKHDEALSARPIAEKVVAKMKRRMRGKVVNIKNVIDGRATAEELHKTGVTHSEVSQVNGWRGPDCMIQR